MWEKLEKGRTLFQFRPKVDKKIKYKFETRKGEIVVSQLRTGYVGLNEYLFKSKIVTCNKCQCREIESVKHYLLECVMYDSARENMKRKFFCFFCFCHLLPSFNFLKIMLGLRGDAALKQFFLAGYQSIK